jgi:hypothetical protein
MATTVRQPKPTKKGFPGDNPSNRSVPPLPHFTCSANPLTIPRSRQPAWGGARSSPSFSPSPNNARLPNGPPPATSQAVSFPPLGPSTPTPRQDHKVILQNLAGLTVRLIYHQPITMILMFLTQKGTTVTLLTKTAKRYEGAIASTTESEGDTTGVTLRNAKELTAPSAPVKSQIFIASTNIDSWSPVPASSNTSAPTPPITNSRGDGKEKTLLQTLAGLTVCDVHDAHIALAHFIDSIRVRPSPSLPRLRNVMRASLPPLQGKEIRRDLLSATPRNCLIPVPLSRISSLLLHLISTPGLLVRQILRFQMEIVGVNQLFKHLLTLSTSIW